MTALTDADLVALAEAGAGWCNEETFAALIALARRAQRMDVLIQDVGPILDVLIEDRETLIGEECEIARDMRDRVNTILSEPGA